MCSACGPTLMLLVFIARCVLSIHRYSVNRYKQKSEDVAFTTPSEPTVIFPVFYLMMRHDNG